MKIKLNYFKELDGIRAIAAIMVILFHYFKDLHTDNSVLLMVKKFASFGQTGVSLFFVLSGFLITRILLSTKDLPNYFSNFYVRRTLRIFPLYYLFLGIYYFLVPQLTKTPIPPFSDQVYFWTYLQNFAYTFNWKTQGPRQYWSLSVEEHFYLFWPFLVYYTNVKNLKKTIWLIVVLAFFIRLWLSESGYPVPYFTFARIDELAIGGLLAIWEIKGKLKSINPNKFAVAILILTLPALALWFATRGSEFGWLQVTKYILLASIYFSVIGFTVTANTDHWFNRFLKNKFFAFTGKVSYGLYVYHPLCFTLTAYYLKINSPLWLFIIGTTSSYLVAILSYNLFESKFITLKKYFEYKIDTKKVAI